MTATLAAGAVVVASPAVAGSNGPIILMGIDAEDLDHGPVATYTNIVSSLLADADKGSKILVLGGGKVATDRVTTFWKDIDFDLDDAPGNNVVFRNGVGGVDEPFGAYELVVVSSHGDHAGGGLTDAENNVLAARDADFADHVNDGGGLLGFTQAGFASPYPYLGDIGAFSVTALPGSGKDNITATLAGTAVGIGNSLDVCCWHDKFNAFPAFLTPLAHYAGTNDVAAVGGESVNVVFPLVITKTADSPSSLAGTTNGYSILIENHNDSNVTVTSIRDTLPAGFSHRPGSTSGATTADPTPLGPQLAWNGNFILFPGTVLLLQFDVFVSSNAGVYTNSAQVTTLPAAAGASVANTAPITVVRRKSRTDAAPAIVAAETMPPGASLYVLTMSATVTDASNAAPALSMANLLVSFTVSSPLGSFGCNDFTDANGVASCGVSVTNEVLLVADLGYLAAFSTNLTYFGSSDTATLTEVNGNGLP